MAEYAMAAGLVAVADVTSSTPLSGLITKVFNGIGGLIQNNVP